MTSSIPQRSQLSCKWPSRDKMRSNSQKLVQLCTLGATQAIAAAVLAMFLITLAGNVQADGRSAAPSSVVPRKPPFNGSIFGKRSMWPTNLDNSISYGSVSNSQADSSQSSTLDELNFLVQQQQEALIRATLNHCYNMQQALASETELALCASFLSTSSSSPKKSLTDGGNWFGQLVSM